MLARLQETGSSHGLVGLGICEVEPFDEARDEMNRRLTSGESGRMRFTFSDPGIATDVRRSFPWAIRLVVCATTYLPAAGNPGPGRANHGRVARFATSDHYAALRRALSALAEVLQAAGHRAEVLIDDNRLVDRAAAVRAGIAWWGKSTMALMPKYGPWTLLGSIATDAVLPVAEPMLRDCGTCVACIPACPTGALDNEGTLDATRCISYWAQMPGAIPIPIREAWGDRLYGCDSCLDTCPPGQRWLNLAPSDGTGRVPLLEALTQSDDELHKVYAHFYVPRNDPDYLRRNALVALGHCGGSEAIPVVAGYLADVRPMLRSHAAWALGRMGGLAAESALEAALKTEQDFAVRAELEAALERAPTFSSRPRGAPTVNP
jgi:epoxyqueuosine reductase